MTNVYEKFCQIPFINNSFGRISPPCETLMKNSKITTDLNRKVTWKVWNGTKRWSNHKTTFCTNLKTALSPLSPFVSNFHPLWEYLYASKLWKGCFYLRRWLLLMNCTYFSLKLWMLAERCLSYNPTLSMTGSWVIFFTTSHA